MTAVRKPWHAIFRLLERDERVFAVLLAVAMVGGLATLGLVPLSPRFRIDLYSLVVWFALYKIGIFALVTVHPRAPVDLPRRARRGSAARLRARLPRAAVEVSTIALLPLVAVNAYTWNLDRVHHRVVAGGLWRRPRRWRPRGLADGSSAAGVLFGLPAVTGRPSRPRRRARARSSGSTTSSRNAEPSAGAQQELLARAMATVGRLSSRWRTRFVTDRAIESTRDARGHRAGTLGRRHGDAGSWWRIVTGEPIDASPRNTLAFARFPRRTSKRSRSTTSCRSSRTSSGSGGPPGADDAVETIRPPEAGDRSELLRQPF